MNNNNSKFPFANAILICTIGTAMSLGCLICATAVWLVISVRAMKTSASMARSELPTVLSHVAASHSAARLWNHWLFSGDRLGALASDQELIQSSDLANRSWIW
jgi:hypothetical protein